MACALTSRSVQSFTACSKVSSSSRRPCVRVSAAPEQKKLEATGYIAEDNSGRGNIFPTRQQAYIKTGPDQVASSGLGGIQGAGLVAGALALVAAVTLFTTKSGGPETLATVANSGGGDSLTAIAGRIKSSL